MFRGRKITEVEKAMTKCGIITGEGIGKSVIDLLHLHGYRENVHRLSSDEIIMKFVCPANSPVIDGFSIWKESPDHRIMLAAGTKVSSYTNEWALTIWSFSHERQIKESVNFEHPLIDEKLFLANNV